QRALAGGEDVVLRRRRERHALRLGGRLPALPGLERDLVAAPDQFAPERDDRERVAWIAERAEQEPTRALRYAASSASSAIFRSWSMRSSRVQAIGVIPSV